MIANLASNVAMSSWWMQVLPCLIVGGCFLLGVGVRMFLLPRLLRLASQTRREGSEVVIRAIRGPVIFWSLMAGLYLAMKCSKVPVEAVDVAGRALKALWIFSVAWVGANTFAQLITHYTSKWQLTLPTTSLTQNLVKGAIFVLGALMILDSLGVQIGSLLAALGIGSLAVALGLQDTLANLFAGMYVTLSKNILVGDYIKLESGQEGWVTDIGWRATKIQMLSNNVVIIPNAKFGQSIITNYCLPTRELAVLVEVGVDYASDLDMVERVTCEVAREVMRTVPGGVPTFEPVVRYHGFGDFAIQFTVVMRAKEFVDQYLLIHEFLKRLHRRYQQEGIVIPSPIKAVQFKAAS